MPAKRGRTESPDNARKRDPSSHSRRSTSIQRLDGLSSPERSMIAAGRASTSAPGSEASSSINRSSLTPTNSHALSSIIDSPELNRTFLHSAKQNTAVIDTDVRETGFATPSTNGEQTHEGTIVSPYVANNFRYPPSTSLTVYPPTESFPRLRSGDVLIKTAIQPARQWQLHSHILMRHSPWFARAMQDTVQSGGERPTWFLFMIEDINSSVSLVRYDVRGKFLAIEDTQGDALSRIAIKSEDSADAIAPSLETPASTPRLEDSAIALTPTKDYTSLVDIYDQVFGAFYNIPLPAPPTNTTTALSHAENVVEIADNLGCLHLLTSHIGNTLLQHRQSLFTSIKDDPARWLLLALSLQNDNLYTESLIHLIGAHPCWPWPTKKASLPAEIRRLVAQKSRLLDQKCLETERDLLTLTIDVRSRPVVPEVASQFDTWFVVCTFRHVLATEITSLENDRRAALKRGAVFRKIYKGGCEYMDVENMRRYMEEIMPSAVGTVGEDLAMLKDFAKMYGRELAGNELMLDVEANPVGYLTCAKVGAEDIPWRAAGLGGV